MEQMDIFLDKLAKHLVGKHGKGLSDSVIVFPNRRSGLFFQRYMSGCVTETMWAPRILTINELMQEISTLVPSDPIDLQFELYDIYKSLTPVPDAFDEFYPWGEMMANDFVHLDKYLVNPDEIFRNIKELKEIDERFGGLEEEQIIYIRKFWKNFHDGEMSREKEIFLRTWELLPKIYHRLTDKLKQKGEGTEGMIYREVAEMESLKLAGRLPGKHYIFAGFNALSVCEKRLFKRLSDRGVADFYWDYDTKYLKDASMEAGRFMRDNLKDFPAPDDLEIFNSLSAKKEIRIFDLPTDVLQAKTIFQILGNRNQEITDVNDTAIVACDENLLMPVLGSLPEGTGPVNITMGYPFKNTPVFGLTEAILRLVKNARKTKEGHAQFYYKDVLSVLNHTYYRLISADEAVLLQEKMVVENRVYLDADFFKQPFDQLIFKEVRSIAELVGYLDAIFKFILARVQSGEQNYGADLEKEYLLLLLTRLNKLSDQLTGREEIEIPSFIRLFRKIIVHQRVPFSGEPLAGLQIMGILETRLLDFRHVVLLSMNEDVMPRSNPGNSFIPYSLRFGYQLPTREDMDAIYAYYFYRLIQRAERVDLLFNSASEGTNSGEMSRYLYQMKYNFGAEIIRPLMSVAGTEKAVPEIIKNAGIMQLLERYLAGNEQDRYLSPSALNTYIECSLKFYFRNLAGIYKKEEVKEEIDAIGLGNIVHETMSKLYAPFMEGGIPADRDSLEVLLKEHRVEPVLRDVFREVYFNNDARRKIEGKNLIIYEIIKNYLFQIIRTDMGLAPIRIVDLEAKYLAEVNIRKSVGRTAVVVGGKIDRIDETDQGISRIIDYKTGNAELRFKSLEALFDKEEKGRNKEAFQALLYAWLYMKNRTVDHVEPGLYVMRRIFNQEYSPVFRIGSKNDIHDFGNFAGYSEEFETRLIALLEELYDPGVPFQQTTVTDRCKYCDFNILCQRT